MNLLSNLGKCFFHDWFVMVAFRSLGDIVSCYDTHARYLVRRYDQGEVMGSAINGHLVDAIQYLEAALALIDAHDAPAHIGAHIDLSICQLKEHLEAGNSDLDVTVRSLQASAPLSNYS